MIHFFESLPGYILNVARDVNPGWWLITGVVVLGAIAVYLIVTAP